MTTCDKDGGGVKNHERPRRRREDNNRMDLKDIGINRRNWVDSAQDRDHWRTLVNAALNLRVPQSMGLDKSTGKIPL